MQYTGNTKCNNTIKALKLKVKCTCRADRWVTNTNNFVKGKVKAWSF